jgi:hypothetical protein
MWFDDPYEEQEREQEQYEYEDKLREENENLRELAERAWKAAEMLCQAWEGPCKNDGVTTYKPCPMMEWDELCVYGQLQRDLRDMGIEVDG